MTKHPLPTLDPHEILTPELRDYLQTLQAQDRWEDPALFTAHLLVLIESLHRLTEDIQRLADRA